MSSALLHLGRKNDLLEGAFIDRYASLLKWALHLTQGDQAAAEDLVHDAYLQFCRSGQSLDEIQNLDGYLYSVLKYLHQSNLKRTARFPLKVLSPVEYDNVASSLNLQALDDGLSVQNDLRLLSFYLLSRKSRVKGASLLVLRFFHGYLPTDIVRMVRIAPLTFRQHLHAIRREAKSFLKSPEKLRQFHESRMPLPIPATYVLPVVEFSLHLHANIFNAVEGDHLAAGRLREDGSTLQCGELAHLVSCRECLAAITERMDILPPTPRDPESTSEPKKRVTAIRGESPAESNTVSLLAQSRERLRETLNHFPEYLYLLVNGSVVARQQVTSSLSRLRVPVDEGVTVRYLEVCSEQGVRLAFLVASDTPPDGPFELTYSNELSFDRHLFLRLQFMSSGCLLSMDYADPAFDAISAATSDIDTERALKAEMPAPLFQSFLTNRIELGWRRFSQFQAWLHPKPLTAATAIITAIAVVLVQTAASPLPAQEIMRRANAWQVGAVSNSNNVLHRTFSYTVRADQAGMDTRPTKQRKVETWRNVRSGAEIVRLVDTNAKVLQSVTGAYRDPLSVETAWEYQPTADSFRSLLRDGVTPTVTRQRTSVALITPEVTLELDKESFRPTGETIRLSNTVVEFHEVLTEALPERETPLAINPKASARADDSSRSSASLSELPSEEMLRSAELAARIRLHRSGLDLGEDINFKENGNRVEVYGTASSTAHYKRILSRLADIAYLKIGIKSPDVSTSRPLAVGSPDNLRSSDMLDAPHPPLLDPWLATRFSSLDERSEFIDRGYQLADECMWRSKALRDLKKRYPVSSDPAVTALVQDQVETLRVRLAALQKWMAELPASSPMVSVGAPPADSGAIADELYVRLKSVEKRIVLLTGSYQNDKSAVVDPVSTVVAGCKSDLEVAIDLSNRLKTTP
jgi:DNA-directed RNA polymerase specialized sigma24 family protein